MAKQIWIPKLQIVALPETMDALEAAMLEPVALVGAGPIGLLILQVLKFAGAGDVDVIEPLAHRRAAALELGAKDVSATAEDFVDRAGKGGRPLVIEATTIAPSDSETRCAPRGLEAGSFLQAFRMAMPTRFRPRRRAGAA
jgi:L-iditol 2-dehydrogenase